MRSGRIYFSLLVLVEEMIAQPKFRTIYLSTNTFYRNKAKNVMKFILDKQCISYKVNKNRIELENKSKIDFDLYEGNKS